MGGIGQLCHVKCAMMLKESPRRGNARADIRARGFWGWQQSAFFDVYGFFTPTHQATATPASQPCTEGKSKPERESMVTEMASFTPLIFATTGGMGREATAFYKRLADLMAVKNSAPYSTTLAWMRCTLSFSLLRSAVMCMRGSRSSSHRVPVASLELGVAESHLSC